MNVIRNAGRPLTTAADMANTLAGTAPSHRFYVFFHTPQPPAEYPSRISSAVQRALQLNVLKLGGLVNFSWSPNQAVWSNTGGTQTTERYYATAFTPSGRLDLEISLSNIDAVVDKLKSHVEKSSLDTHMSDNVHLYVCTHGARDCRCGNAGGLVAQALREEIAKRELSQVKVAEVGHVGGHAYAANLLVYPHGEWLGNLDAGLVPDVLNAILERPVRPSTLNERPLFHSHWRGRMGLDKEQQLQLYTSFTQM